MSTDSASVEGNGQSLGATISADGRYVAFISQASNLVADDTNGFTDVFLKDTVAATTTRVSVDSAELEGNHVSSAARPAVSADGRYVAFDSRASNLVADDTNGASDVFLRDTVAGTTTRVSVDSAELEADYASYFSAVSADGRYVAFDSYATNLVPDDTNGLPDVFVRDTLSGTTTRVNVDSAEMQANNASPGSLPAISADGRFVAFMSTASNLVAGDTNHTDDVFLRDTVAGTTTRVSLDTAGGEANSNSGTPAISADGSYVAYWSLATNLVADDTNGTWDVFVRDTVAGTTTRVSVDSAGVEGNGPSHSSVDSYGPAISADGRYVAFDSLATNLVADDTNGTWDVFVRDTMAGTTARVSVDSAGAEGNSASLGPALSADGRYVAFDSLATNLVADDTNGTWDVYRSVRR